MNLEDFEFDESALAEAEQRREQQLAEDEKPIEENEDDCEGCKI